MPIDTERALAAKLAPQPFSWAERDVVLYQLGLGAGHDPTDPRELAYVYERNLKVLPSFGVLPALGAVAQLPLVDGLDFDPAMVLHAEHEVELVRELPAQAAVTTEAAVTAIYDKGSAALVKVEATSSENGAPLCRNRFGAFIRGEGGFGGPRGPGAADRRPERAPDAVVMTPTLPQQALMYRLSGDPNPLHADPEVARAVGFDRPILHGLCTYGAVLRAVVEAALDGDTGRVRGYRARFAGVVFPGESLVTEMWSEDDRTLVETHVADRGAAVLTNAAVDLR